MYGICNDCDSNLNWIMFVDKNFLNVFKFFVVLVLDKISVGFFLN